MHYLQSKKLYIFDMDGTIYLGSRVFPFAVDFISALRREGKKILFFTNNASHSPEHYMNKLTRLGLNPSREELLTSGDVTIRYLNCHRAGKKVFLVGTPELCEQFIAGNVQLSEEADIVVTSFDTTLTYEKLRIACQLIHNGAEYLCTHPDFNCPVENGFIPDSGSIAALVTASTGVTPQYFGKPHKEAVNAICDITEVNTKDMVIFGDRLYTDIAFGKRHGITSVLVLTGETKQPDVESDSADYVFPSLLEVHELWDK
ncbi:MAG: HAD-IIA family hydrolase [Eubacteriales bacterium]|jgi:4-nitrophenyl phosphatase|nr:HAD-IIA family hydrolase [Eubacteriales bacterium]